MASNDEPILVNREKSFGGWTGFYKHFSKVCNQEMRFAAFIPPQAAKRKVPILYWLPGIASNEKIFMMKSGAQETASELGLMLVVPDSSPRGTSIEGAKRSRDLGEGASFYVNATTPKWAPHFQMFDYITIELPNIIYNYFPGLKNHEGIFGHGMGGHGAIVASLRQPERYLSTSAFAPICSVMNSSWGRNALHHYLGKDKEKWKPYDACHLVSETKKRFHILIDQGAKDQFIKTELKPETLQEACRKVGFPIQFRMHPEHGHSYYFISTFIKDHLEFHAERLKVM